MKEEIFKILDNVQNLTSIAKENFEEEKIIVLNNDFFNEKYLTNNITKASEHLALFNELLSIKQPILYWFTFNSDKKEAIRTKYHHCKEKFLNDKELYRNICSHKKDFSKGNNVLYVGKVKNGFWGRIITHLGYSVSPKTAGLQLFHWYKIEEFGELTLHYIKLDKSMSNLISLLEIELAQKLNPILGKY